MDRNQRLVLSDMAQLVGRVESFTMVEDSIAFDGYSNTFAIVNSNRIDVFGPSPYHSTSVGEALTVEDLRKNGPLSIVTRVAKKVSLPSFLRKFLPC